MVQLLSCGIVDTWNGLHVELSSYSIALFTGT